MNRVLNPSLNPAGLSSAVLALYALAIGIWNVAHHGPAIDPQVIVAAVAAVAALFTRQVVTPVADPKNGAGEPLLTYNQHAAEHLKAALASPERAIYGEAPAPVVTLRGNFTDAQFRAITDAVRSAQPGTPAAPSVAPTAVPLPVSSDPRERSAQ